MPELAEVLASYTGAGYVVAPAGFGKTHLIAQSVSRSAGRQLVLTHTYAGVNALRRKMRERSVRSSAFQIDTIASWALRVCVSYREASGWSVECPQGDSEWAGVYQACSGLLNNDFMRRIVRASYVGLYVDEYQDCSTAQHGIILQLARDLPCRVFGDPLQAVFDFAGQPSVNWGTDVAGNFKRLGALDTPHRWNAAPEVGVWLREARESLEARRAIDLTQKLPPGITFKHCMSSASALFMLQANTCRYFGCEAGETVIAIHKGDSEYKNKCHNLARQTLGRFSSIEEIEGKSLSSFVRKITAAKTSKKRLKLLVDFADQCMTGVKPVLSAATKRGDATEVRANTKNPELVRLANGFFSEASSANMGAFLLALKAAADVRVTRADLFNRMLGVLRKQKMHPDLNLAEAAEKYQGEFRYKGRPVGHRKQIATTLLVKGLEFQHAIVLDAASLRKNELYVALTRGAKSLTILSTAPTLNPTD